MTTGNPFSNPFKIDPAQLKFEVARARAAAGAKGFRDLVEAAEEPYANESVSKLPVIDLAELQGYPPSREYCWGNLIQLGITTMLTGKGGVGKSLLALNLCASVAAGRTFLGLETVAMKALFLTVEDDRDEVWRRLTSHVLWHGSSIEGLQGRLLISTLCGEVETALAVLAERGGVMEVTYRWRQLRAAVLASGARLVVLDNATDMMAGDLNDIHQVAEFVNLLTSLAIEIKGAVVILHHPNKAGDEWLGSVAWHNKVRSRLVVEDGGVAGDPDARVLINPKANYGQQGGRVAFRWHEGTLVSEADMSDGARAQLAETAQAGGDNNLFMACLAERTRQHRAVSDKRSPTFAPAVFAEMPEAKGIGKRRLEAAMERLFRLGRIERAELWKGDDRKPVFGLRELAGNGAADTVRNTRATQVSAAEKGAGNAGNTHTMSFRFQQRSRAYKNLQAEQAERGKRNGLFSLRREPTPTAGFSLPNAKAEFERQQRLYKQASLQLNTRPAAPGPVVNLPQFKGGGGGGGARRVPRGGGGPSVADKAVETAKRNAEDFAQELARLNDDLLSVKRENLTDLAQIATIDRQQIGAAAMQLQTTIEADVISGKYSRAQADQLEEKGWQVAAEKLLTVNTQQAQQQSDDLLRFQLAANDNQRELLDIQGRLAMTAEDRRRVALNLLALDKQEEKARLDAVIASAKAGALEKQIAAARLSQLDALYSARGAVVAQDTAGPLEAYAKSLTMTPGQINEAVQQIKVDGLKALNDGLVDAIVNFKSLGDVASNVIRTIASELVQLAVSKYITGPLANILGLGAGGGGGGTAGTVSSGISFLGKSFGGRANGGPVNAGRPYLVGERGIPEMFVPATGGRIVPLTRPPMPGRGANERTWTININFPAGVSAREARQSGAQAARAFREEQGRQMRIGG